MLRVLCSCSYLVTFLSSSQFCWHVRLKSTAYFFDPPCIGGLRLRRRRGNAAGPITGSRLASRSRRDTEVGEWKQRHFVGPSASAINISAARVLSARCYASAVLAMGLCPCLSVSVTSRCSVETDERIELVIGVWASFHPSYTVLKGNSVISKIRELPSGTLS